MRIGFKQFLLPESKTLMGTKDWGEFKAPAIECFESQLQTTVETTLRIDADLGLGSGKR
jgi:hypothetical protein